MVWYEIYKGNTTWDIYKVTEDGRCFQLIKQVKTEAAAKTFAKKHWVKRWG